MPQSRVQEYITIAMFELLEKKDYAHITVQDLVDRRSDRTHGVVCAKQL